jgi:hypothetical protein
MVWKLKFHKDQILLWTKDEFHSNMVNTVKWKSFMISDKINILAQVDMNVGSYTELVSRSVHTKLVVKKVGQSKNRKWKLQKIK